MSDDCIFCKLAQGRIPTGKVFESERIFAFRDTNPQAPVHVLAIPKEHVATLNDLRLRPDLLGELMAAGVRIAAEQGLAEGGYRLVLNCGGDGGQTVFHVHLHVLGGRRLGWPPG